MKSTEERETILRTSQADKVWVCWSDDPVLIRKMTTKFGAGKPKGAGFEWVVQKKQIRFVSLSSAPRPGRASLANLKRPGPKEPGTEIVAPARQNGL